MGMRPTDRGWGLGGTLRPSSMERVPGSRFLTRRLGFHLTHAANWGLPTEVALDQLRQAQPDVLVGSASSLAWLTGLMTPGDRVRSRLRYISTAGETCTAEMRRQEPEPEAVSRVVQAAIEARRPKARYVAGFSLMGRLVLRLGAGVWDVVVRQMFKIARG